MRNKWLHHLRIADVFHNDALDITTKAATIADRIERLPLTAGDRLEAKALADDLRETQTADEFDVVWSEFYDFADWARIWVATV